MSYILRWYTGSTAEEYLGKSGAWAHKRSEAKRFETAEDAKLEEPPGAYYYGGDDDTGWKVLRLVSKPRLTAAERLMLLVVMNSAPEVTWVEVIGKKS